MIFEVLESEKGCNFYMENVTLWMQQLPSNLALKGYNNEKVSHPERRA